VQRIVGVDWPAAVLVTGIPSPSASPSSRRLSARRLGRTSPRSGGRYPVGQRRQGGRPGPWSRDSGPWWKKLAETQMREQRRIIAVFRTGQQRREKKCTRWKKDPGWRSTPVGRHRPLNIRLGVVLVIVSNLHGDNSGTADAKPPFGRGGVAGQRGGRNRIRVVVAAGQATDPAPLCLGAGSGVGARLLSPDRIVGLAARSRGRPRRKAKKLPTVLSPVIKGRSLVGIKDTWGRAGLGQSGSQ